MNDNTEGKATFGRTEALVRFRLGLAELQAIRSESDLEHSMEIGVQLTVAGFARRARLSSLFIRSPDRLLELRIALDHIAKQFRSYGRRPSYVRREK